MKVHSFLCLCLIAFGCTGSRDYYVVNEPGPGGRVVPRKVYYTPEEKARRNEALGIPKPPPPDLAEVQALWPQLTDEQRTTIVQTVRQMTSPTQ